MIEILVATALMGAAGLVAFELVRVGSTNTVQASEHESAVLLAGRVVDRLLAGGYPGLAALAERSGDVDLAALEAADRTGRRELIVDGLRYRATWRVDRLEPELLRLHLTLTWERAAPSAAAPGTLEVVRFLADPESGTTARMSWAEYGGQTYGAMER